MNRTSTPLTASSSTTGFFQALPILPPQYTLPSSSSRTSAISISDDKPLARVLALYLPPAPPPNITSHLHSFARLVLHPSTLAHSTDAEINHPALRPFTTFGAPNLTDPLWTTRGWQALKALGYEQGVVAVAYDTQQNAYNRRIYEFALGHLWSCTATMTGCPMSMTDGAAALLRAHVGDEDGEERGRGAVFAEAYRRLTSRDAGEAWTSGQWMTERTGGSDVSGTETMARRVGAAELSQKRAARGGDCDAVGMPLGPWEIDGFKWFSSATDSEMAVLLAQTEKGGLSAFYIPMRRRTGRLYSAVDGKEDVHETELNGIRISRLKNKLGTKSLPTAELELKGARGWLIGTEGKGVKEISAILTLTRLHTGAGSSANWARGLAVCRAYSKVRKVRGGLLQDNALHLRWMAEETVKYSAAAHFSFFTVALYGALEQGWHAAVRGTAAEKLIPQNAKEIAVLLRLLSPVMKAQVSVASVHGLRQCMECLGGVGYCENNEDGGLMNIAKIYRDNLVNPIWEGTVNVMAEDVVRVLTDKRLADGDVIGNVFAPWVHRVLGSCPPSYHVEVEETQARLEVLRKSTAKVSKEDLLYHGRETLEHIEIIICSALLLYDSSISRDNIAEAIAFRYIQSKSVSGKQLRDKLSQGEQVPIDRSIFLGGNATQPSRMEKL